MVWGCCLSIHECITQTCPTYANFNNAHIQDEDQTRDNPGLHPLLQRYLSDVVCACTVSCHLVELVSVVAVFAGRQVVVGSLCSCCWYCFPSILFGLGCSWIVINCDVGYLGMLSVFVWPS